MKNRCVCRDLVFILPGIVSQQAMRRDRLHRQAALHELHRVQDVSRWLLQGRLQRRSWLRDIVHCHVRRLDVPGLRAVSGWILHWHPVPWQRVLANAAHLCQVHALQQHSCRAVLCVWMHGQGADGGAHVCGLCEALWRRAVHCAGVQRLDQLPVRGAVPALPGVQVR